MPDIPSITPNVKNRYVVSFVDVHGNISQMSLEGYDATVTEAQLQSVRAAAGQISNAVIFREQMTKQTEVNRANDSVIAMDEAYAEVSDKARLDFQDDNLEVVRVTVPAPDATVFVSGTDMVNAGNTLIASFIAQMTAVLNTPSGSFSFVRGVRVGPGRKIIPRTLPAAAEPEAGDSPPPEPGLLPPP